ncbi:MAG: hypothetical protein K2P78_04155 [Gemmataceae bacterium]|nr:hypothetical protein [Gemmataceae bacterium]
MSIEVFELATSRPTSISWDSSDITLKYFARGSTDPTSIRAAVLLVAPRAYLRLRRKACTCEPQGAGLWTADVEYGFQLASADATTDPPDQTASDKTIMGPEWNFDTTGGSLRITQSKQTRSKTKRGGGNAPDYKQAIGVTRDSVEGCEIFAPKLEFSVTIQKLQVSTGFMRDIAYGVGYTNKQAWYGFPADTVLFLGASGSAKPGERFSITYKFAAGENRKNVEIAPGLTIPEKRAWDYVWCSYANDVNQNFVVQLPVAAYVERVYDSIDFDFLLG